MNVSVNIYIQAFVAEYLSGRNASQNRIGRLMLREDGTGAIEYFYRSEERRVGKESRYRGWAEQ